jgi:alkyl sulfatase BDS1-like metallo-beta-lactamase superfamily hydrolase
VSCDCHYLATENGSAAEHSASNYTSATGDNLLVLTKRDEHHNITSDAGEIRTVVDVACKDARRKYASTKSTNPQAASAPSSTMVWEHVHLDHGWSVQGVGASHADHHSGGCSHLVKRGFVVQVCHDKGNIGHIC